MDNLTRIIQLADEFFETKNDPSQLTITEKVMEQLRSIHPATMGEFTYGKGPVAWTIIFPTTRAIREEFVNGAIGETELMKLTLDQCNSDRPDRQLQVDGQVEVDGHVRFSSLYLCSALVEPEFRGEGLSKKLVCDSIQLIQKDHPIDELFVWTFSGEGKHLAKSVASSAGLPLFERKEYCSAPFKSG